MHNEAATGKTNVKTEPIDKPSDMPMNARRATGFGFYLPATEAEAPKRRETGNPFRGCNRAPPRRNPEPVDSREGSRGRAHSPTLPQQRRQIHSMEKKYKMPPAREGNRSVKSEMPSR